MSLNLSKPDRTIHVGIILLSERTEFQDVAPADMLHGMASNFIATMPLTDNLKAQALSMEFHWIGAEGAGAMKGLTSGAEIKLTDSFTTCPPLDITIIGAGRPGYEPSAAELSFIRKAHAESSAFMTVCGGVEYALRAGVLSGKTATGPRFILPVLQQMAPDVTWVEQRWARDGKVWTSGALINGLDMMRAFMEEYWGGEERLGGFMSRIGGAPVRDLMYGDEKKLVEGFIF